MTENREILRKLMKMALIFCYGKKTDDYDQVGLITLTETNSETDSDSDSKPDGYIVRYRNFPMHRLGLGLGSLLPISV